MNTSTRPKAFRTSVTLHRLAFAAVAVALIALAPSTATATVHDCVHYEGKDKIWFTDSKPNVSVYMNDSRVRGLPAATGFNADEMEEAIHRALYIWNEQSGGRIRMHYVGRTEQTSIDNAIVVLGDTTSLSGSSNQGAMADTHVDFDGLSNDTWNWSQITFYLFRANGSFSPWVLGPVIDEIAEDRVDVVATLIHELGHAAFNFGHPNGIDYPNCQYPFPIASVMGRATRNLGPWDLELVQSRYGVRSISSTMVTTTMTSPTTWAPAEPAAEDDGTRPLFRFGSLGQGLYVRPVAWVDNGLPGNTLRDGGLGWLYSVGQYKEDSLESWNYLEAAFGRPPAMAAQPYVGDVVNPPVELLFAYQKFTGTNVYVSAGAKVCWRRSTDGGLTWDAEDCASVETDVYGMTATYDPYSKNFLISYVRMTSTIYNQVVVVTVPTNDSSTLFVQTHALPISALHAPSIACTGTANQCLLAYERPNGYLGGTYIGIAANTVGTLNIGSSFSWGMILMDTPGLVYLPDDGTFRLAQTLSNNSIYSYKMAIDDPKLEWLGTGDIWNDIPDSYVSTGVLNVRNRGGVNELEAWFVKYW